MVSLLPHLRRWLGHRANPLLTLALALRDPYLHPRVVDAAAEKRVLVLAPHMDDEAIGCGGAVLLHVAAGATVTVAYITDGRAGDARLYDPAVPLSAHTAIREALHATRVNEATRWCEEAAVQSPVFLNGPDARMASAVHTLAPTLRALIEQCRPELVYLPSPLDTHPDHQATNHLLRAALRESDAPGCRLRGYEVWNPLVANAVMDVSPVWQRKCALLQLYASQLKDIDYVRLVGGLNTYRAVLLPGHCGHAEAFLDLSVQQHRALLHDATGRADAGVARRSSGPSSPPVERSLQTDLERPSFRAAPQQRQEPVVRGPRPRLIARLSILLKDSI